VKASAVGAAAIIGALAYSPGAQAAIAVFGGGEGEACWRAALAVVLIHMDSATEEARWKAAAIAVCDGAIAGPELSRRDLASTWVNRGILEMSRQSYKVAEDNFHQALKLSPNLAEAHVNLGSAMINMRQYEEALAETKLGIDLHSSEVERAWYNMGLAYEFEGRLQEAYDAYGTASKLKPDWDAPKTEMARFTTRSVEVSK
jgi:tetratricopeptide (TPR) repeat protein